MSDTRIESDSIGEIAVPANAYWGAQTQRSIENFPFGTRERMPIEIVHALALVKQAAARVNRRHGLSAKKADAIEAAVRETSESAGVGLGKLAQPLRSALTGRTVSPGIFDVLLLLGRDASLARLDAAHNYPAGA